MGPGSSSAELAVRALPAGGSGRAVAEARTLLERWAVLIWGGLAYGLFVTSLTQFVGFVSGLGDRAIDSAPVGGLWPALGVDALLTFAFASSLPLALAARACVRRRVPGVSVAVERSIPIAVPSLLLLLLVSEWRALPLLVWHVEDPLCRAGLWGASAFGWTLVGGSTFMLDHLELFGLRQAWRHFRGRPPEASSVRARWAYRFVRHPLIGGLLVGLWAAPTLTAGRALLAGLLTLHVVAWVFLEQCRRCGELWEAYREQSPAIPRRARSG